MSSIESQRAPAGHLPTTLAGGWLELEKALSVNRSTGTPGRSRR